MFAVEPVAARTGMTGEPLPLWPDIELRPVTVPATEPAAWPESGWRQPVPMQRPDHPVPSIDGVKMDELASIVTRGLPPHAIRRFTGLRDEALLQAIRLYAKQHVMLSYRSARHLMFSDIDNHAGIVTGVYTGRAVCTKTTPDIDATGFNTEHTLPYSKGIKGRAGGSDLHHLFPTDAETNNIRSNHDFGEVVEVEWEGYGCKLGKDEHGKTVFEPPDAHKGNVARALFYVSAIYSLPIPDDEEAVLKRWNHQDPVDAAERHRNDLISRYQNNRNPYIDQPALADRIADF